MANYPYPTGMPTPMSGVAAARPSTAVPGTMYYATDTKAISVYDSALGWIALGGGTVTSVAATDASIVVGGTASAPTIATGTLDVIATQHAPVAAVAMNSQKITGLANGSASTDAAAYGQLPIFAIQAAEITTSEATTSLSFTDLTTPGPAVTVTITSSGKAIVFWGYGGTSSLQADGLAMGYALSGANTVAAGSNENLFCSNPNSTGAGLTSFTASRFYMHTGLTAGSTTFTAKYEAVAGGTATFLQRWIMVFAL